MANYEGDNRDNTFRGTKKRDTIDGGGGDDTLFGLAGNDEIDGGDGDDTIDGGVGADDVDGGAGRDTLVLDHGAGNARFRADIEFEWSRTGYSGVLESSLGKTRFSDFETIEATLGRGNDHVVFDGAGLASRTNVSIDANDGSDLLEADFRAIRNLSFVVGRTGTATTKNGSFAGFEAFDLTLGAGRNTVTTGKFGDVITSLNGGIDTVDGGAGSDRYVWRAKGAGGSIATIDKNGLSFTDGAAITNVETYDLTFGAGDNALTIKAATGLSATFGAGADRLTLDSTAMELSLYAPALGAGNDTVTLNASRNFIRLDDLDLGEGDDVFRMGGTAVMSAENINGGAGADSFFYAGKEANFSFVGGDDAAVDTVTISFANEGFSTDPYITTYRVQVTGSETGLAGNFDNQRFRQNTFAGIEAVNLTLTGGRDEVTIDRAAGASGRVIAIDAGRGVDKLTLDLGGLSDVTFAPDATGRYVSGAQSYTGFEHVALTVGGGSNTVTLGLGNDTVVSSGTVDVIDMGGNTKVDGVLGIDRYTGSTTTTDDLTLQVVAGLATISNGTTVRNAEAFGYTLGAGDDVIDLPQGIGNVVINGGAGLDTLNLIAPIGSPQVDADANGLKLGTAITGIETMNLVYTGTAGQFATVSGAAIASGLSIAIDAGGGSDLLRVDYSGVDNTVFKVDDNNNVTASRGDFRGFERFEVTLGGGSNDVAFAYVGSSVVTTGGVDTVAFGGGFGGYEGFLADAGGSYSFTEQMMTSSSGSSVRGAVRYDLVGGAGVDRFDVESLTTRQDFSFYGGAAEDLFTLSSGLASTWWRGGTGSDTFVVEDGFARIFGYREPEPAYVYETGPDLGTDKVVVAFGAKTAAMSATISAGGSGLSGSAVVGLGGLGADFSGIEIVDLQFGSGNDTLRLTTQALASTYAIKVAGGAGTDTVALDYSTISNVTFMVNVDGSVSAGRVALSGFEAIDVSLGGGTNSVTGGAFADRLAGSAAIDAIGADTLDGRGGDDNLSGGLGTDRLVGGEGNDVLDGGAGADNVDGGAGNDTVKGGIGDDTLVGGEGDDTLSYDGVTAGVTVTLIDGVQATGGGGTDTISGFEHLVGSGFADTLTGNAAANRISGGLGSDVIEGGGGADQLSGGAGADRFVFRSVADIAAGEKVTDFFFGNTLDKIDLSAIDPDAAVEGDQSFTFIGTAEFTAGSPNYQLRVIEDESAGFGVFTVEGDINRDGVADFTLTVVTSRDSGSISYIGESNFIL